MRSDPALRPVLRMSPSLPDLPGVSSSERVERMMRGVVQLSGGETDPDLGSGSSNLGRRSRWRHRYSDRGSCNSAATWATPIHRRSDLGVPDALFQPGRKPAGAGRGIHDAAIRITAIGGPVAGVRGGRLAGAADAAQLFDESAGPPGNRRPFAAGIRLLLEAVDFIDHLNLVSPYAKLDYDLASKGALEMAFSAGTSGSEMRTSMAGCRRRMRSRI